MNIFNIPELIMTIAEYCELSDVISLNTIDRFTHEILMDRDNINLVRSTTRIVRCDTIATTMRRSRYSQDRTRLIYGTCSIEEGTTTWRMRVHASTIISPIKVYRRASLVFSYTVRGLEATISRGEEVRLVLPTEVEPYFHENIVLINCSCDKSKIARNSIVDNYALPTRYFVSHGDVQYQYDSSGNLVRRDNRSRQEYSIYRDGKEIISYRMGIYTIPSIQKSRSADSYSIVIDKNDLEIIGKYGVTRVPL